MVGVLEKCRIDLHLPGKDWPHLLRHLVPGGNFSRSLREFGVTRDDPEFLLAGEDLFAQLVPALIKLAFVLADPVLGYVMRGMASARCKVHEERLVRHQR